MELQRKEVDQPTVVMLWSVTMKYVVEKLALLTLYFIDYALLVGGCASDQFRDQ